MIGGGLARGETKPSWYLQAIQGGCAFVQGSIKASESSEAFEVSLKRGNKVVSKSVLDPMLLKIGKSGIWMPPHLASAFPVDNMQNGNELLCYSESLDFEGVLITEMNLSDPGDESWFVIKYTEISGKSFYVVLARVPKTEEALLEDLKKHLLKSPKGD